MMRSYTIDELKRMRESEDHVEFKRGKNGNVSYNGADKTVPKERRKCILGYVTALCNERGGRLVIGMEDKWPHDVCGTQQAKDALGKLESRIYKDSGIRPMIYELFENDVKDDDHRVLVIEVPSRPVGKTFKFEDVALMRSGEELLPMDDKTYLSIIQEQEPDFSATVCEGLTIEDLDQKAIDIMKEKYGDKNDNPGFENLSNEQALSDLELLVEGKLNYAALILLGKSKAIRKFLPQNNVVIEYRDDPASIQFDDRQEVQQPLFLAIDNIWSYINQPSLNPQEHIREKAYIYDIKRFNEETIREAVLNAIAHRSMIVQNDVVIKLSPHELAITNAGGFPIGVDKSNVLTVNSTPRSKRLAEVLQKTGLVEKSGQGVDKMFTNCIMEAKPLPDYSDTDDYQVSLKFATEIRNVSFMIYIRQLQNRRPARHKLNVFQLIAIYNVCFGDGPEVNPDVVEQLVEDGIIVRTKAGKLTMSKDYQKIYSELNSSGSVDWVRALKMCSASYENVISRKRYMEYLPKGISVDKVRYVLAKLESMGVLEREGAGKGTTYRVVRIPAQISI